MSLLYRIPPSEIGQRLTSHDVGQILAFERIQDKLRAEAQRTAELEDRARTQRQKVMGDG